MAKLTRIKNFYKLAQIEYNKYKNSKDKDLEGADHLAEAGQYVNPITSSALVSTVSDTSAVTIV